MGERDGSRLVSKFCQSLNNLQNRGPDGPQRYLSDDGEDSHHGDEGSDGCRGKLDHLEEETEPLGWKTQEIPGRDERPPGGSTLMVFGCRFSLACEDI